MRLAVFTNKYPGRVATFFERDMRGLIEAGIDVDVFAIYPLDAKLWAYSLDTLNEQVLPRNKVRHLGLGQSLKTLRPYPTKKFGSYLRDVAATSASSVRHGVSALAKTNYVLPKAWAWAQKYQDYDHVLAYWGNYTGTCAYAFHRLLDRQIPFSIWLHAGADLYETPTFLRQKLLYADRIVTCCEFNLNYLGKNYSDIFPAVLAKTTVCYHGLDFANFPYQPDGRQDKKILAVGRLSEEKGFDYLLRAAREIIARGTFLEIDFVGDGPDGASLKALAADLGIADYVKFRGWLKFSDVQAAMREATMLVHPSPGIGDGLPNVIREAMALGTPVIASDVAGIHEAFDDGKCGLLVPPRDVNALINAIETLLSNNHLRRSFAEAARKHTEDKFDMWRNGKRLAEVLRNTRRVVSESEVSTKTDAPVQTHPQELF